MEKYLTHLLQLILYTQGKLQYKTVESFNLTYFFLVPFDQL